MASPPPRPRAGMRDVGPAPSNNRELSPGSVVLGRYTIQKVLGRGGMATVYLAKHQQTERLVALKLLDPEISRDPNYVERFRREARAAGRIRSDFVVAIYDLDAEVGGSLVLVMEYLEGQTVQQAMKAGRMPLQRVLSFGRHLLEGLAAAHAAGVIHRDLKPANLFIERSSTGGEKCKILDFGISKLADASQQELTRDGQTLGTVAYMAPEQIRGKASSTDPRIDLYAAGVTLFIMFTGKRPIDADDTVQLLAAVLENPPLTLAQAAGVPFPLPLEQFIAKALQKDPNHRFQTALEMRDALIEAGRSVGYEATGALQLPNAPPAAVAAPPGGTDTSTPSGVRSRTAMGMGGPPVGAPRPTLMGVGNQGGAPVTSGPMAPPSGPMAMPPLAGSRPRDPTPMPGPPAMLPPTTLPSAAVPAGAFAPPPPPLPGPGASATSNPFGPTPPLPAVAQGPRAVTGPVPAVNVPTAVAAPGPLGSGRTRVALGLAAVGTLALVVTAVVLTLHDRAPQPATAAPPIAVAATHPMATPPVAAPQPAVAVRPAAPTPAVVAPAPIAQQPVQPPPPVVAPAPAPVAHVQPPPTPAATQPSHDSTSGSSEHSSSHETALQAFPAPTTHSGSSSDSSHGSSGSSSGSSHSSSSGGAGTTVTLNHPGSSGSSSTTSSSSSSGTSSSGGHSHGHGHGHAGIVEAAPF